MLDFFMRQKNLELQSSKAMMTHLQINGSALLSTVKCCQYKW